MTAHAEHPAPSPRAMPYAVAITLMGLEIFLAVAFVPGGRPARSARTPSASAVSGVWLAGLITPVQPAAQPGAARVSIGLRMDRR